MIDLLFFFLTFIYIKLFMPMLMEMLSSTILVKDNYRGDKIPNSLGIGFTFSLLLAYLTIKLLFGEIGEHDRVFFLGFSFMSMIGFIDDSIGDTEIKGLKGHFKAFFSGKLTTGGLKATLGMALALFTSLYLKGSRIEIIINTLIIGLSINLLNLFDLRPGRAIKVFFFFSILVFIFSFSSGYNYIILSIYGIILGYMNIDFKAKAMMGDSGSNALGFALGFYLCLVLTFELKLMYLALLLLIHFLAEKVSFSKVIENNKLLNFIDKIGRE